MLFGSEAKSGYNGPMLESPFSDRRIELGQPPIPMHEKNRSSPEQHYFSRNK
jgi:hypothetical protein